MAPELTTTDGATERRGISTWKAVATDQTLENATGVGAPPWTWPRDELVIDVLHKAVYAFATGAVADRLIPSPAR